jgi:CheY-like chemotaxis protein
MFGFLKSKNSVEYSTGHEVIEQYTTEIKKIKIENQPFRLSGMLHILTNKVSDLLKSNRHLIYYDVENEVGRYIVGDNDYLEQVLEIIVRDLLSLNTDYEVVLKISKLKNKFLVFDVINEKGVMPKDLCRAYTESERLLSTLSEGTNAFIKAKKIVEGMQGTISLNSSRGGTHYTIQIPFYEDKDTRSNQEELRSVLKGKNALFIGRDKHDTKRTQYIFETYGIHIENMKLEVFEKKKPNLKNYDMAIIRSADLNYKHVSFFKTIYQDPKSSFKIIIVHELFESEDKVALSKNIAHAELYNPSVIGDVEEILFQMFLLKSKAVKGISNMEVFDHESFTIKGKPKSKDEGVDWYKGAHIAVVEDSKVDQRVIRNILKFDGVTLYCMNNGQEMLDLLEKEEIDIIFSDINMPVMDGLLMTKQIRSQKRWENIPIISISSMAFPHEVEEMKLAGMNASIRKPIQAEDVYMALDTYLVMTAQMRNRDIKTHQVKFSFNKDVIDIDLGVSKAKNPEAYQKHLTETMEMLSGSREAFAKMIYDQQTTALGKFARTTLLLYESIYATEMIKMFKELLQFVSQRQRVYLIDYIYIYQKNWKRLEKEFEKYIDNVQE